MSGFIRQIQSSDGTPITPPSTVLSTVNGWEVFANDAAFEDFYGAGTQGNAYFNSTDLTLRAHNGTEWVYIQNGINSIEDSATSGANQDLDPTYHNLLKLTNAGLTSVRSLDPGQTTVCYLANDTGADITLQHNESGATAANRLLLPDSVAFTLGDGNVAHFVYDSIASRWRYTNTPGEGGGGTGGAAGKNYVLNPSALSDLSDITSSTAGTWNVNRTTTASELPEPSVGTAIKISGTDLTAGDYVEWAMLPTFIDDGDGGRIGTARLYLKDISGAVSGDVELRVYDATASAYIEQQADDITGDGLYLASVPLTAESDIRVRLVATGTTVDEFAVSTVTLEPGVPQQGALIGEWQDAGLTASDISGFGTVSDIRIERKIVGTDIYLRGEFRSGTPAASEAQIGLGGYTVSSSSQVTEFIVGFAGRDSSNVQIVMPMLATNGDTFLNVGLSRHDTNNNIVSAANGNSLVGTSEFFKFNAGPITVAELSQAATPLASDVQYENYEAQFNTIGASITTSLADLRFTTIEFEDAASGAYDTSTGIFTAPSDGEYTFKGALTLNGGPTLVQVQLADISNTPLKYAEASDNSLTFSFTKKMSASEQVKLRAVTGGATGTSAGAAYEYLTIQRKSRYSARATGLPTSQIASSDQQFLVPEIRNDSGSFQVYITNGSAGGSAVSAQYTIVDKLVTIKVPICVFNVGSSSLYLSTSPTTQAWPSELTPVNTQYPFIRARQAPNTTHGHLTMNSSGVNQIFIDAAGSVFGGSVVDKGLNHSTFSYLLR